MAQIQQGATPTHKFRTPYHKGFVEGVIVTYAQGGNIVVEKKGDDVVIGDKELSVTLSQDETLAFSDEDVEIQIKVKSKNGTVIPSKIIYASVAKVLNREVM
jgi:hypothetical protein